MSIEEQIKRIAREEIQGQLSAIEADRRVYLEKEIGEMKEQLADLNSRVEKLEAKLDEKMNLMVKIRKYTLDQLMSEYNRLADIIRHPDKDETAENAEI